MSIGFYVRLANVSRIDQRLQRSALAREAYGASRGLWIVLIEFKELLIAGFHIIDIEPQFSGFSDKSDQEIE